MLPSYTFSARLTAYQVVSVAMAQLVLFVVNVMIASNTGVDIYGDFAVAMSAITLISAIFCFGRDATAFDYLSRNNHKRNKSKVRLAMYSFVEFSKQKYLVMLLFGVVLAGVWGIISIMYRNHAVFQYHHVLWYYLWVALFISIYNVMLSFFLSIESIVTYTISYVMQSLIYIVGVFLLVVFYSMGEVYHTAHIVLFVTVVSFVLVDIVLLLLLFRSKYFKKKGVSSQEIKEYNKKSKWKNDIFGMVITNIDNYRILFIPLWFLEVMGSHIGLGETAVGVYAVLLAILSLAALVLAPFAIIVAARYANHLHHLSRNIYSICVKYTFVGLALAIIIASIMYLFMPFIVELFGRSYVLYIPLFRLSLLHIIFWGMSVPLLLALRYSKKGGAMCKKFMLFGCFISLIVTIASVSLWGLKGAVYAVLLVDLITFIYLVSYLMICGSVAKQHQVC